MWVIFLWMRSQHKCISFYFPKLEGKFRKFCMYVLPRVGFTSRTLYFFYDRNCKIATISSQLSKPDALLCLIEFFRNYYYWEVSSQFFSVTLEYLHCVTQSHRQFWQCCHYYLVLSCNKPVLCCSSLHFFPLLDEILKKLSSLPCSKAVS